MTERARDPIAFPPAGALPLAELVAAHRRARTDVGLPSLVGERRQWLPWRDWSHERESLHPVVQDAYEHGGHCAFLAAGPRKSFADKVAGFLVDPGRCRRARLGIVLTARINQARNLVVTWEPECGDAGGRPDADVWRPFIGRNGRLPADQLLHVANAALHRAFSPFDRLPDDFKAREEAATKSWSIALIDALVRYVRDDLRSRFEVRDRQSVTALAMPLDGGPGPIDLGSSSPAAPWLLAEYAPCGDAAADPVWRGYEIGRLCRTYGLPVADYDDGSADIIMSALIESERRAGRAVRGPPDMVDGAFADVDAFSGPA